MKLRLRNPHSVWNGPLIYLAVCCLTILTALLPLAVLESLGIPL